MQVHHIRPGTQDPSQRSKALAAILTLTILLAACGGPPTATPSPLQPKDTNPAAAIGEDLLDIRGKVTSIDVLSKQDAATVLGVIDDQYTVERLVELVLGAPVDQAGDDTVGARYFLGFRLADGTSVVRAFWLETGELARGIKTPPAVSLFVWSALGRNNRPVAADSGPKVYETLAARLGLGYLSLPLPEVEVTGVPHSPVARLVRLSEFDALEGGGNPVRSDDPLVWVVKAQGSWRTGGIVPEQYREDLALGVVAFNADTGSQIAGYFPKVEPW